jgi:hypothetical protein
MLDRYDAHLDPGMIGLPSRPMGSSQEDVLVRS